MVEGHEDARCTETYRLSVVTKDFVYYLRDDADEISGTVMLNIHLQLVSDNYFGCQDLISVVLENKDIVWMSKKAKEWQRVYTDISEQPPDVKNALLKVNVACLNDEERKIYHAYKNIGPAKYTKSECLMAVISNQLESYSPELASIIKLLDEAHGKS